MLDLAHICCACLANGIESDWRGFFCPPGYYNDFATLTFNRLDGGMQHLLHQSVSLRGGVHSVQEAISTQLSSAEYFNFFFVSLVLYSAPAFKSHFIADLGHVLLAAVCWVLLDLRSSHTQVRQLRNKRRQAFIYV